MFQVPEKLSKNIQIKKRPRNPVTVKGELLVGTSPTDGATTALPGSPFHTGLVLIKKECLCKAMEAYVTCFF